MRSCHPGAATSLMLAAALCWLTIGTSPALSQTGLVNWENPHVHPIDITPDGTRLLAVNTPDNRLEVFSIAGGHPVRLGSVPVGIDPVSVRARDNHHAWVVNHISDSISIVDLTSLRVVATLDTDDEPADVVFAGNPPQAFVSCSQANTVLVFNPANLSMPPVQLILQGEDPRAMAVSPDGSTVYVAIFESGNRSTILGGGSTMAIAFPPNVVSSPLGPYGGQNPPPNFGAQFNPPINPALPPPPKVGLIVRKNAAGQWMDDNNGDWTSLVSGPLAAQSGRPIGWDLLDHDIAVIDADTLSVTYARHLMNICMAIAVNPATGAVTVVGTEATNEIRFEPILRGTFVRVHVALWDPANPSDPAIVDLNPHLDYSTPTQPQAVRDLSLGDPRGIAWTADGTRAYVTGMGSNNLVAIESDGARVSGLAPIAVGEGPTGLVLDELRNRLYVLNKFSASLSVVDTLTLHELARIPLYDPSPPAIRLGRKFLYDTHRTSGLGQASCASCHVDARMDRLAWDLGDPTEPMKAFNQNCLPAPLGGCQPWHPMKGPMTTQTLQDIIGKEPHHWRGDREGIEAFNLAFVGLLGDDATLTPQEMQQFEDFLATIHFPPNPFRNFNNTLPTSLPLPGHFTTGDFGPAGLPLPNGNAVNGLQLFRTGDLDQGIDCVTCHTLPTGAGTNYKLSGFTFQPVPPGPNGEKHLAIVGVDGSTNVSIKIPHLRNMHEKVGFEATQQYNLAGFGFLHDGSIDSLARFVAEPVFLTANDQQVADLVAFMLAFAGSELPMGSPTNPFELPGELGNDTHAAVGAQITFHGPNNSDPAALNLLSAMVSLSSANKVGLVARRNTGETSARGYMHVGSGLMQADRLAEMTTVNDLRNAAAPGAEVTFTVVPIGTQKRIGIDRDADGFLDRDELDACSNPANPLSVPGSPRVFGDADAGGDFNVGDVPEMIACLAGPGVTPAEFCLCLFDAGGPDDGDGDFDLADVALLMNTLGG